MRRIASSLVLAVLAVIATALVAATALAAPHFHSAGSSVGSDGSLVVSFDERGLGGTDVSYLLEGDSTASWGCFNRGGKNPAASNKRTSSSPFSSTDSFAVRNGRVVADITSDPPAVPSDFSCPSGQTLRLMSVSYTGITLTDTTNGVSTSVPDASRTFISG
jgi:hypothetical protein